MRPVRALAKVPRWTRYAWPHARRALREPRYGLAVAHAGWALWRQGGLRAIELGIATSSPAISDYGAWVRMYDTLTPSDRQAIGARAANLSSEDFPDVVVLVSAAAGASVRVVIVEGPDAAAPTDLGVAGERTLRSLRRQVDPRWRALVVNVTPSRSLPQALNATLAEVTGSSFVVIDAGDELAPHALYRLAEEKHAHPECVLAYSDEDSLGAGRRRGRRSPCFKPDWSPEYVLASGGVGRLAAFDTELTRGLSGFAAGSGEAAELDLLLRMSEVAGSGQIRHIAEVLVHREEGPAPPGLAAARAVSGHLHRSHRRAAVALTGGGLRVMDELPSPPPGVTLVMPTRDEPALLQQTVESLWSSTDYPSLELVIVDNGSTDLAAVDLLQALVGRPGIQVVRSPGPFNFAHLINTGVDAARSEIVALVNNDLLVLEPLWLQELVGLVSLSGVGAAGACLRFPDLSLQHGGIVTGLGGVAGHWHKSLPRGEPGHCGRAARRREVAALTGACLVTHRDLFQSLGGMDEANLPVAFNDVDLCLRIEDAGYRLLWSPYAELEHLESASRGPEDQPVKVARFEAEVAFMKRRWGARLSADPYYNANLTLDREDCTLAWPPRTVRAWHHNWGRAPEHPARQDRILIDTAAL